MHQGTRSLWGRWLTNPWFVFWIALFMHGAVVFAIGHYKKPRLWENGGMAQSLYEGQGMRSGFSIENELTSWQAPGYPYLLSASWKVLGKNTVAFLLISLLQAVAVSSMVFPMGWLARRWFSEDVAVFCRWVTCFMPLYIWYATRLHHTALVMAFHPWLVWGWLTLAEAPNVRRVLWAGLGTGIAGLFQPVLLAIFGILSLVKSIVAGMRREFRAAASIWIAGFLTLLALTPWTLRNYHVHGRLLLIKDSFGKEFWMGNNPHATGTGYAEGGEQEITYAYPPKALELRGKVSEIELMDALQKEAWEYCKAEPGAFFQRTMKKIAWFWTMTPSRFERGQEVAKFRWLQAGYWFLFLTLAVVAVVKYRPWSCEYSALLLLYAVFYSLVYGLTHVGQARFRGEIEYIFLPAVAAGLAVLWRTWCKKAETTSPTVPGS